MRTPKRRRTRTACTSIRRSNTAQRSAIVPCPRSRWSPPSKWGVRPRRARCARFGLPRPCRVRLCARRPRKRPMPRRPRPSRGNRWRRDRRRPTPRGPCLHRPPPYIQPKSRQSRPRRRSIRPRSAMSTRPRSRTTPRTALCCVPHPPPLLRANRTRLRCRPCPRPRCRTTSTHDRPALPPRPNRVNAGLRPLADRRKEPAIVRARTPRDPPPPHREHRETQRRTQARRPSARHRRHLHRHRHLHLHLRPHPRPSSPPDRRPPPCTAALPSSSSVDRRSRPRNRPARTTAPAMSGGAWLRAASLARKDPMPRVARRLSP